MTDKQAPQNTPDEIELRLLQAKKLMEWNEDRFGEPTTLEYLRYYKSGTIKEIHIEAVVQALITAARIEGIKSILVIGKERMHDDTYPLEAFIEDCEEYLSRVYGATLTNDKIEGEHGGLEEDSDGSE